MRHYLLTYEVDAMFVERRAEFRDEHLALAWAAVYAGELVLGGAGDAASQQAWLLFKGESPESAERFANHDPYVRKGLVKSWRVNEWHTVVGLGASRPLRPQ